MNDIYDLGMKEFAHIFNIGEEEMPPECVDIINKRDFRYRVVDEQVKDKIILDLMKKIDASTFTIAGEGKKDKWEKGWQEILDNFIASGYSKEALIPQYFKSKILFLDKVYIKPIDKHFENNFVDVLRMLLLSLYFADFEHIYEFGCGSCANLFSFAECAPDKSFYGYDWVEQSKLIIDKMREENNMLNVHGGVFDMFYPDRNLDIKENSVSFTLGSMEQLGDRYWGFLEFLLNKPFTRHIHINSILEFYDTDTSLVDYLIYKLERHRNYLNGFFTKLMRLEKEGVIRILKMDRVRCEGVSGGGYSITIWEKI